jgi:hypothetical protein
MLTSAERKTLADNIRAMANATENGTKGLFGAEKVRAMQALGLTPDDLYKGIPQSKVPASTAWLRASGLIIRDQSGAAITNSEELRNWQLYGPQPGDNAATVRYRLSEIERRANNMAKTAGPNAAKRLVDPPKVKSVSDMSAEEREAVIEAFKNPDSPFAEDVLKEAGRSDLLPKLEQARKGKRGK